MLKDIFFLKKLSFELEKLNEKTLIITSRDDILNFEILCTQKKYRNWEKKENVVSDL